MPSARQATTAADARDAETVALVARGDMARDARGDAARARGRAEEAKSFARRRDETTATTTTTRAVTGALVACALLACAMARSTTTTRGTTARATATALGAARGARDDGEPRVFSYDVVETYAHDPRAFTQGLTMCGDGIMCESTGAVGGTPSEVRTTTTTTGARRAGADVSGAFAEGLTRVGDDVHVISWKSNRGFTYAVTAEGEVRKKWTFETPLSDGWGVTSLEGELYVTDASDKLHVLDVPGRDGAKLTLKRSMTITDDGKPIRFANELETIGREVYANILERPCLARIDPANGKVTAWVNLDGLKQASPNDGRGDVLNGIAYDEKLDALYVTGKNWPTMFRLQLREEQGASLDSVRATCTPPSSLPGYGYL